MTSPGFPPVARAEHRLLTCVTNARSALAPAPGAGALPFWAPYAITPYTRAQLASLRQTAPGSTEWAFYGRTGATPFKPYFTIGGETTLLYQFVT